MLIKTIFAGFGGQGVLLMGYAFAYAAMKEDKHVTYLPSYGAEMRGGTANCIVAISDEEIASPVASSPDIAVVLNKPSLLRFQNQVQSGGVLFINSDLVDTLPVRGDIKIYQVPANRISEELGSDRSANMVMLGAFINRSRLISLESAKEACHEIFKTKPSVIDVNKKALEAGYQYLENEKGDK